MLRIRLTLAGLVVAGAAVGLTAQGALAAHDAWYGYATSLTAAQGATSFTTDTLAPGGGGAAQGGYRFVTDTLAPGGGASQQPGTVSVGRSFAWSDAGIGSLVTLGGLLVLLGGSVLVRHRAQQPAV